MWGLSIDKGGAPLKRDSKDLVFPHSVLEPRRPRRPRNVTKEFLRKADAPGFAGFRFHDLRHTHASLLLKDGVNLKIVSARLGHAKASITLDIYQHLLPGMQGEAATRIDEIIDGARTV